MALEQPSVPAIRLEDLPGIGTTLVITPTNTSLPEQVQISMAPDFAAAAWQPLPLRRPWPWPAGRPRVAWVRFRDSAGAIGPAQAVGSDAQRIYLPLATSAR